MSKYIENMTVEQALEYVQLEQAQRYLNEHGITIIRETRELHDAAAVAIYERKQRLINEIKESQ